MATIENHPSDLRLLFRTLFSIFILWMMSACATREPESFKVQKIKEERSGRYILLEIKYRGDWIVAAKRYYIRAHGHVILHGEQLSETKVNSPLFNVVYYRNGNFIERHQTIRW